MGASSSKGAQRFPVQDHQGNSGTRSSSNAPMDEKPVIHQDDEQSQCQYAIHLSHPKLSVVVNRHERLM